MAGGRPTKLTEEVLEAAREYLPSCKDEVEVVGDQKPIVIRKVNLPSIEGLALHLGIHRDTIYDWSAPLHRDLPDSSLTKEELEFGLICQEFSDIVNNVRQEQAKRLLNKGLSGEYNPTIAKLILSKHGYTEKTETDITTKGEALNTLPDPERAASYTEYLKHRS